MTRPKKIRPGRGQRNLDGTIHCLRCGRLLVQATAIQRGYGRGCWRRQKAAAAGAKKDEG